ncbi:MAG: hypothetical protein HDKAJFGB_00297 [Anaerolineae bacterium]|nr:hypothetical protein [Anaerolineae bacterium]
MPQPHAYAVDAVNASKNKNASREMRHKTRMGNLL